MFSVHYEDEQVVRMNGLSAGIAAPDQSTHAENSALLASTSPRRLPPSPQRVVNSYPRFKRPSSHSTGSCGGRKQALYCRPLTERRRDAWCRSFGRASIGHVDSPSPIREAYEEEESRGSADFPDVMRYDKNSAMVGVDEPLSPAMATDSGQNGSSSPVSSTAFSRAAAAGDDRQSLLKRTSLPRLVYMKTVEHSPTSSLSSSCPSSPIVDSDTSASQCLFSSYTTGVKREADRVVSVDSPLALRCYTARSSSDAGKLEDFGETAAGDQRLHTHPSFFPISFERVSACADAPMESNEPECKDLCSVDNSTSTGASQPAVSPVTDSGLETHAENSRRMISQISRLSRQYSTSETGDKSRALYESSVLDDSSPVTSKDSTGMTSYGKEASSFSCDSEEEEGLRSSVTLSFMVTSV